MHKIFLPRLAEFTEKIQPFEKDHHEAPTIKEANYVMSNMVRKNTLDTFFEEAFCLGGALMSTSLNYLADRDLIRNPE